MIIEIKIGGHEIMVMHARYCWRLISIVAVTIIAGCANKAAESVSETPVHAESAQLTQSVATFESTTKGQNSDVWGNGQKITFAKIKIKNGGKSDLTLRGIASGNNLSIVAPDSSIQTQTPDGKWVEALPVLADITFQEKLLEIDRNTDAEVLVPLDPLVFSPDKKNNDWRICVRGYGGDMKKERLEICTLKFTLKNG